MYACVKRIASKLSEHYNAQSFTISIQDGKDAGQSVPVGGDGTCLESSCLS